MKFDLWWKSNMPDISVDMYSKVKDVCRLAWETSRDEERDRCGLIAETYPFSPVIGKGIAASIYRGNKDE